MSRQYFCELLAWTSGAATAVANTTTETEIFNPVTILANYLNGTRTLQLLAYGKLSTTATPTILFSIRWGGVAGTLLALTEAITNGSGVTNVNWCVEAMIQTQLDGSTGSLMVMGRATVHTGATAVVQNVFGVSGFDAPAAVTVDLTADKVLSLTATWSAASASNTLTGLMRYLWSWN